MKLLSRLRSNNEDNEPNEDEYPKYRDEERKTLETYFTTYTLKIVKKDGSEQYMDCEDYELSTGEVSTSHDSFHRRSTTKFNAQSSDYLKISFLDEIKTRKKNPNLKTELDQNRTLNMDEIYMYDKVDEKRKVAKQDVTVATKEYVRFGELRTKRVVKKEHGEPEVEEVDE